MTPTPGGERTRKLFEELDASGLGDQIVWTNRYVIALENELLARGLDEAIDNAVRRANGEDARDA